MWWLSGLPQNHGVHRVGALNYYEAVCFANVLGKEKKGNPERDVLFCDSFFNKYIHLILFSCFILEPSKYCNVTFTKFSA